MNIHFIGIGGIGMSALAGITLHDGHKVSGSDNQASDITKDLAKLGAKIYIGHRKENIPPKTDLVVITSAIEKDNVELCQAKHRKIKIQSRSEYLGRLMKKKRSIAVAGTHGKTTISSMISVILKKAELKPTIAVGGLIPEFKNKNWSFGEGKYMVVEACEYKSSFLKLTPFVSIISNIEEEHLDCFKNLDEIISTFNKFLDLTNKEGFAVINADDLNTQKILKKEHAFPVHTYGIRGGNAEWQMSGIKEEAGKVSFSVYKNNQHIDDFTLRMPGEHNASNALAAIIVSAEIGVNLKTIKNALADFSGTKRRSELKGEKRGVLVVDDYGHHPTEIKKTLAALRNFYSDRKKMWCVFQPHQYSRTKLLFNDFLESFEAPDNVIIPDIYRVRDTQKDVQSTSSKELAKALQKKGVKAIYISTFTKISNYLKKNAQKGDLIVTMGAGPVNEVGENFLRK